MPFYTPNTTLRQPSLKRISTPNSVRLTTITEGAGGSPPTVPPIPRRSSRRNSASHSEEHSARRSHRWSGSGTSTRTAPPPYEWVPETVPAKDEDEVIIDPELEKLRRERRGKGGEEKMWKRGGLVRAVGVGVAVLVVVAIALGVGLGLGLKKGKGGTEDASEGGAASNGTDKPPQKFPMGEYSLDTALMSVSTSCTSNPATWRCYPYSIYSADGSTDDTSLAVFNWIISNTSQTYATTSTGSTSGAGVPANLTVSTSNDPFGLMFADKELTYVSDALNATSARYTFEFEMERRVIPSPAITSDNTNAECYFNSTVFTASIYLAAERTIFPGDSSTTTSEGGYEPWPFAVEIQQSANGGANVPNCYQLVDGNTGAQITDELIEQPSTAECMCEYRNY